MSLSLTARRAFTAFKMAEPLSDVDSFSDFHEEEEEYKPSESDSETTDNDNDHVTSETPCNTQKQKSNRKLSKKFVRKQKVMKGEQHVSDKGKTVRPKVCKPLSCCRTCHLSCSDKVSEYRQQQIFQYFYSLDWISKDAFLSGQISVEPAKRKYTKKETSRKQKTKSYRLQDENGNDHKVCEEFLKNVLDVSDGKITNALNRKAYTGTPISDKCDKHAPHNKRNRGDAEYLMEFINKFPVYESHYCMHHTSKKYLPPNLNMSLMYTEYKKSCEVVEKKPLSLFVFRDTFNSSFNLSFQGPQKDTCQKCDYFKTLLKTLNKGEEKTKIEVERKLHQKKSRSCEAIKEERN
ncbi:uncharacterized protein [Diabrotica undecimpunctata]|uniref:uncharacterized protein n=1 Tax=Diabrotica undecimpunctata TaxID=50387 RepID=UPI003B636088